MPKLRIKQIPNAQAIFKMVRLKQINLDEKEWYEAPLEARKMLWRKYKDEIVKKIMIPGVEPKDVLDKYELILLNRVIKDKQI